MKKNILTGFSIAFVLALAGCSANLSLNNINRFNHIFDESTASLKTKAGYADEKGNKGLLLYGYDNGASINFGCSYSGVFTASVKPVKNDFGNIDLKEFSLLFTEKSTKEQFSIKTFIYSNYYYVAICYDGQVAGNNYYESEWSTGKQYGFTGIANNEGRYTKVDADKNIELLFDPAAMKVQTKLNDDDYHDVWDFTKPYNDGKYLRNTLSSFDDYDISIIFDSVSANGCGDLLLYSFAGYNLSNETLNSVSPIITTHIKTNAIVGQIYNVPMPSIVSPVDGELDGNDIHISVYDRNGNTVTLSDRKFIPSTRGEYFLYYKYNKNGLSASTYIKIMAMNAGEASFEFSDVYFPSHYGLGQIIIVPDATIETSLGTHNSSFNCDVTIRKDGSVYNDHFKEKTGQEFTFTEKGTYTFTYSNDAFETTMVKTVIIDGRLAINESETPVFRIGEAFKVPEIEFIKGGRTAGYTTKVYSPLSILMEAPFIIEQEGYYTVEYDIESEATPLVRSYIVQKNVTSYFNSEDSTFGPMTTNNEIKGLKISLKNNEVVRYNKVINLNDYAYDNNLSDPSLNKEVARFYIQPKTQGLNDLDAFYIQLTDAHDENNYITIRLRYLNYFNGGCFVRAKASTQGTYVGYNYNFRTTKISVDNASSHEEGGFQSYCNFTSHVNGAEYKDMGFPLYFDNNTGCLYSRPAWLTGHNEEPGDDYEGLIVPWLVYNFKTDDATRNGGNSPWKGFKNGQVYLSFYGKGISNSADIFVTNIDGNELNSEFINDTEKPVINIDHSAFSYNSVTESYIAPDAKIGSSYPLFDFTAEDSSSTIGSKSIEVYDPDGQQVVVTNNEFTPTKIGNYRIVYIAKDVFNNEAREEVIVNATDALTPISVSLNSPLPSEIIYGREVILPKATYSGGSGKLSLDVKVTSLDGKNIPVNNMKFQALEPSSSYVIDYAVTDYIGNVEHLTQTIAVRRSEEIIYNENLLVLPSAFVKGDPFRFNAISGVYYDENYNAHVVPATISIRDASGDKTIGSDLIYIPSYSDTNNTAQINISFSYGSHFSSSTYEVPIIQPRTNSSSYISSFFLSEHANVSASSTGLLFSSDGADSMSFEFVRQIDASDLLIDMNLFEDKSSVSNMVVHLRDAGNANETVKLTYSYHYDASLGIDRLFCSINDSSEEYIVNTGSENILRISYNNNTHELRDATGTVVTNILNYENEEVFAGFSSGNVYFSFEANDITDGNFEIMMTRINNQGTNISRNDYQEPDIIVNGVIVSRVPQGTTVELPTAFCYDVLNAVGELTVSVRDESGKVILPETDCNSVHSVKLDDCGTYVVTYSVEDANGNAAERVYVITVYDDVKPTLNFKSAMPEKVKTGSTVKLPEYTIVDNDDPSTVTVNCYLYCPDGTVKDVKNNSVTFLESGLYILTYLVTDINGNTTLYTFRITAK